MTIETKKMDNLDNVVIVSDFDGTITNMDTNDLVYFTFGGEESYRIERLISEGKMGIKEGAIRHFQRIHLTEEKFCTFILENVRLDEGFKGFYTSIKKHNVPFVIVSGGYINTIEAFFETEGITGIRTYANRLKFKDRFIEPLFYHEDDTCYSGLGPCGNCKLRHLKDLRKQYQNIIFIGDGLTDRCAVSESDVVFAKDSLREYCISHDIPHIPYNSFHDVSCWIFASNDNE